jgi:hypothetical protein
MLFMYILCLGLLGEQKIVIELSSQPQPKNVAFGTINLWVQRLLNPENTIEGESEMSIYVCIYIYIYIHVYT